MGFHLLSFFQGVELGAPDLNTQPHDPVCLSDRAITGEKPSLNVPQDRRPRLPSGGRKVLKVLPAAREDSQGRYSWTGRMNNRGQCRQANHQ